MFNICYLRMFGYFMCRIDFLGAMIIDLKGYYATFLRTESFDVCKWERKTSTMLNTSFNATRNASSLVNRSDTSHSQVDGLLIMYYSKLQFFDSVIIYVYSCNTLAKLPYYRNVKLFS